MISDDNRRLIIEKINHENVSLIVKGSLHWGTAQTLAMERIASNDQPLG